MLTKADIEKFYTDLDKLGLKRPNAAISKATGESPGNVSKYLNRKQDPSESFLNRFYDHFYKSSKNVSERDLEEVLKELRIWRATVDATLAVLLDEIAPLLVKHSGKSNAGVIAQLKKDIEAGVEYRMAKLNKGQ